MQTYAENDNDLKKQSGADFVSDRALKVAALRSTITQIEYGVETELLEHSDTQDSQQTRDVDTIQFSSGLYHEVWAKRPHDHASATGVMLEALKNDSRPILWVIERAISKDYGIPYGPGLLCHDIDPARCVLVRTQKQQQTLWVIEEALKNDCFSGVFGEISDITLKESRRLSLAAATCDSVMIALLRSEYQPSSAAYSRWQISPTESARQYYAMTAPGPMRASAYLHKHRAGVPPMSTIIERPTVTNFIPLSEQHDEQATDYIHLAAPLAG
jgi:hypothetical protein